MKRLPLDSRRQSLFARWWAIRAAPARYYTDVVGTSAAEASAEVRSWSSSTAAIYGSRDFRSWSAQAACECLRCDETRLRALWRIRSRRRSVRCGFAISMPRRGSDTRRASGTPETHLVRWCSTLAPAGDRSSAPLSTKRLLRVTSTLDLADAHSPPSAIFLRERPHLNLGTGRGASVGSYQTVEAVTGRKVR